jgi:hypothetical protein
MYKKLKWGITFNIKPSYLRCKYFPFSSPDTHNPDASYDKIATLDDTPRVDVTARNGIEKTQTR